MFAHKPLLMVLKSSIIWRRVLSVLMMKDVHGTLCADKRDKREREAEKGWLLPHCQTDHTNTAFLCIIVNLGICWIFTLTNCLLNVNINWVMWAENANRGGKMLILAYTQVVLPYAESTVMALRCYIHTAQSPTMTDSHTHTHNYTFTKRHKREDLPGTVSSLCGQPWEK